MGCFITLTLLIHYTSCAKKSRDFMPVWWRHSITGRASVIASIKCFIKSMFPDASPNLSPIFTALWIVFPNVHLVLVIDLDCPASQAVGSVNFELLTVVFEIQMRVLNEKWFCGMECSNSNIFFDFFHQLVFLPTDYTTFVDLKTLRKIIILCIFQTSATGCLIYIIDFGDVMKCARRY